MPSTRPWLLWGLLGAGAVAAGLFVGGSIAGQASTPAAALPAPVEDDPTAAALRAVRVLGSPEMYDASRRDQVLAEIADPALASRLTTGLSRAAGGLGIDDSGDSEAGTLVARLVPVGHRVVELSNAHAVVAVWSVGLLGVAGPTSAHPVQATWSTDTVTVSRIDGRWLVTDVAHQEGPAPVGTSQVPAPPSVLLKQVQDYGAIE
jgi:hypothetical protein